MIETVAFRLRPGDDLLAGLEKIVTEKQIQAGCVLTCVNTA